MYEDAEQRMLDFMKQLDRPRSVASRVQEMLPLIDEARARGATWPELATVLGIPRSTLLAAYARARKKPGSKAAVPQAPTATGVSAAPAATPAQAPDATAKTTRARKVERWSG